MKGRIERLEERLVYSDSQNPWVKLYFDRVQFPDGHEGYYNRIVESEGRRGVAVLPISNISAGLVRQFRYSVGQELWEIPRGFGDRENVREEASRELQEETGLKIEPEMLIDLGLIHPNSGLLASEVQLFAAKCEGAPKAGAPRDAEISQFHWFPLVEVLSLIGTGKITDAFTLCAVLRAKERSII